MLSFTTHTLLNILFKNNLKKKYEIFLRTGNIIKYFIHLN